MPQVILVDSQDKPIGVAEKLEAHEKGLLHRAFSIFIFSTLQRQEKYVGFIMIRCV